MRSNHLKIIAVVFLGLGLTGLQAQIMNVKEKSNTSTAYLLSDIKKMSFSPGNITISKYDGTSDNYLLKDVRYLDFGITTTGIQEELIPEEAEIRIFPNPVTDVLNIKLAGHEDQGGIIKIISIEGKKFGL